MRLFLLILLTHFSVTAIGQRIDFRNDSLFVNNYYIDGLTKTATLDSLLGAKSKAVKSKGKYVPGAAEDAGWTNYIYASKGLIFTRYNADTIKLSIRVKIHRNENFAVDQSNMPTKPFTGALFIGNHYMNDKRQLEQLEQIKDFIVTYYSLAMYHIRYQQRAIRVMFDVMTKGATIIFIA